MKYLLIVFGEYKGKANLINAIAKSISIISDNEENKFTYGDSNMVMNFFSSEDQEEIYLYIDDILKELSSLYFLTPYNDTVYSSLPMDIHSHLFGLSENTLDDIYDQDIDDIDKPKTQKKENTKAKPEQKTLTLDEILDKILDQGENSLTEQERITLIKYSN